MNYETVPLDLNVFIVNLGATYYVSLVKQLK